MKIDKATLLYSLLPFFLKQETELYLSYKEKKLLETRIKILKKQRQKENKNLKIYQELQPYVQKMIFEYLNEKQKIKGFNKKYASFLWYIVAIFFLAITFSIFKQDYNTFFSFLIYLIFSVIILARQNATYWYQQIKIKPQEFFLTLVATSLIVPLVGHLSLDIENYSPRNSAFFLLAIFAAPFAEELIFRDALYRAFYNNSQPLWILNSMALSSAIFALVHLQRNDFLIEVFLSYFLAGMLLAFLRFWGGKIIYPLIAHALSNLILFLLL